MQMCNLIHITSYKDCQYSKVRVMQQHYNPKSAQQLMVDLSDLVNCPLMIVELSKFPNFQLNEL